MYDFLLQDIQFRVQRPHQQPIVYRTYIQNEHPWKLHQLQDAGNHVQEALLHIDNIEKRCSFWYGHFIG